MKIFLLVIFLLLILVIVANLITSRKIRKELEKLIVNQVSTELVVSFNSVRVNLVSGSLIIKDIVILTKNKDKNHAIECRIPRIKIGGFHIRPYLKNKIVEVDRLIINEPQWELGKDFKPESSKKGENKNPLVKIIIHDIHVKDADFALNSKERKDVNLENLTVKLEDLKYRLDKTDREKLSYNDLQIEFDKAGFYTGDGMYFISTGNFSLNRTKDGAIVKDIILKPLYEKYKFSEKLGYQTDRFDVQLKELKLTGIPIEQYFKDKSVKIKEIELSDVNADVFRNKLLEIPPNHYPAMPQQALLKLPFKLCVDTIRLKNAYVKYSEHVKGADVAGYIFFSDLNGLIHNLNNSPQFFNVKNNIDVFATGSFMGKALARAKIDFMVISDSCDFDFTGSMGAIPMGEFNAMTVPNASLRIDDGELDNLSCKFTGTCTTSSGEVEIHYHDLKVGVLKSSADNEVTEKKLLSFIFNTAIRTSNPPGNKEKPYIAVAGFDRNMHKGILNFVWKSIFSGIKETVTPGKKNLFTR